MNSEEMDLQLGSPMISSMPHVVVVAIEEEALELQLSSLTQPDLQYLNLTTPSKPKGKTNGKDNIGSSPNFTDYQLMSNGIFDDDFTTLASNLRVTTLPTVSLEVGTSSTNGSLKHYSTIKTGPVVECNGIVNVNPIWPFWSRKANQITGEEYEKLYESIGTAKGGEFLAYKDVTIDIDKKAKLRTVLFIPWDTGSKNVQNGDRLMKNFIKLCQGDCLVDANCSNLLPKYLSFMKGTVDSEDAPKFLRNQPDPKSHVSKSNNNNSNYNPSLVKLVRSALGNITLQILEEMNEKHFQKFYDRFSDNLKRGILEDSDNFERILKLLRYQTSACGKDKVSLQDYLIRMKEGQNHIYYDIGESLESIANSKLVERTVKKGFEVIFMIDNPLVEMSVVRKLSESKPLGGKKMILLTDEGTPSGTTSNKDDKQDEVEENIVELENIRPKSPKTKTSSDEDDPSYVDWTELLQELQLRRQPTRQARPKNLKEKTSILGTVATTPATKQAKPTSTPIVSSHPPQVSNKRGRTAKIDDKMVEFEGQNLTLKNFMRLPEMKRDVVESVENAFLDARTRSLCFRVKWKYYPANHKDKYNNEWATNIHNFTGGAEAVEAYIQKIKIRKPHHSKTLKIISDWTDAKTEVAKELSLINPVEDIEILELNIDEGPNSSLKPTTNSSESQEQEISKEIDPIGEEVLASTSTSSKAKVKDSPIVVLEDSDDELILDRLRFNLIRNPLHKGRKVKDSQLKSDAEVDKADKVTEQGQPIESNDILNSTSTLTTNAPRLEQDPQAQSEVEVNDYNEQSKVDKELALEPKPKDSKNSKLTLTAALKRLRKEIQSNAEEDEVKDQSKQNSSTSTISSTQVVNRAMNTTVKHSLYKSIGTCTEEQLLLVKSYRNKGVQTDKPLIKTKIVHWTEEVLRRRQISQGRQGPPAKIIKTEPGVIATTSYRPQIQQHQPQRPPTIPDTFPASAFRGKNWRYRRQQTYWKNKKLNLSEEEFKLFRKQRKQRYKKNKKNKILP